MQNRMRDRLLLRKLENGSMGVEWVEFNVDFLNREHLNWHAICTSPLHDDCPIDRHSGRRGDRVESA